MEARGAFIRLDYVQSALVQVSTSSPPYFLVLLKVGYWWACIVVVIIDVEWGGGKDALAPSEFCLVIFLEYMLCTQNIIE